MDYESSATIAGLVGAIYGRRVRRYLDTELEGFRKAAEAAASR